MTLTERCKVGDHFFFNFMFYNPNNFISIHGYVCFVYFTSIVLSLSLCCRCKRTLIVKPLSCCL